MAEPRRHPRVVNLSEVEARSQETGKRFGFTVKTLGMATGASGVGCSWHEVPPGRTAFPRHFHCANEEALFILEGEGLLKIGEDWVPVRAGDFATFPVGPSFAHQLQNTGAAPLRYLGLSTLHPVEVVGYPDSKKFGLVAAESYQAARQGQQWIRHIFHEGPAAGYYEGEDIG